MTSGLDSLSWFALGAALTVAGLLLSVAVWRRRGAGRGLRAVAWSLLPVAAALTGLLRLLAEIADAVGRWATRLVFSPVVWLGVVVAGVAVLLWVVGGVVQARSDTRSAPSGQVAGAPPERALPRSGRRGREQVVDDQDDIEAILRRHGIQ